MNGSGGYINFLDSLRGWQLVKELKEQTNEVCAASMKHTSPAGVAIYKDFSKDNVVNKEWFYNTMCNTQVPKDKVTSAYIRARNSDPLSSFGDFIAISDTVTLELARYLSGEVSDGIIAPGYEPEALQILKKKKKGQFVVLQMDPDYQPAIGDLEFKELFGIGFVQSRNDEIITRDDLSEIKNEGAIKDLIVASTTLKYAESNTIAVAYDGQLIGLGSGQQSRVSATQLALDKSMTWLLRQCKDVYTNELKDIKHRQEHVNHVMQYIQFNKNVLSKKFDTTSHLLALSSDAFFPFRDNIDLAAKYGVGYIAQPGGSVRDQDIFEACKEHSIKMVCHAKRMFTH